MSEDPSDPIIDDDAPEYDEEFWKDAVRGPFDPSKHPKPVRVVLSPDVAQVFGTSEAVDAALRTFINLKLRLDTAPDRAPQAKSA